jgi:hypothetical protein
MVRVSPAEMQRYGTIVVCGGGCYGGYYVRQLARARAARALSVERVIVVDRDAACRVARLRAAISAGDPDAALQFGWPARVDHADGAAVSDNSAYADLPLDVVVAEWDDFFQRWFAEVLADSSRAAIDAVVPSPLMPNLLANWVELRLRAVHPALDFARVVLGTTPITPWQRTGTDNSHYASFATWMCPINCIEPPKCPETRGPRDWTMPAAIQVAVDTAKRQNDPFDVVAVFQTTHRLFGVGMFSAADAVRADAQIRTASSAALRVLVASVSHCHGALAELRGTTR